MNVPQSHVGQADAQDISSAQGDPYRTPSEVPGDAKRGWLKSPLTWFVAAGVLAGAIVTMAAIRRTGVPGHVEDFGIMRAGPPPEVLREEIAEYEVQAAYEQ